MGTLEDTHKRFWRQASLSIGVPLGNLEESSFTRDFEGKLEGGCFTGDPGGCIKEGYGDEHLSP